MPCRWLMADDGLDMTPKNPKKFIFVVLVTKPDPKQAKSGPAVISSTYMLTCCARVCSADAHVFRSLCCLQARFSLVEPFVHAGTLLGRWMYQQGRCLERMHVDQGKTSLSCHCMPRCSLTLCGSKLYARVVRDRVVRTCQETSIFAETSRGNGCS